MTQSIADRADAIVAEQIKMFTPHVQLARVYRMHREIQDRGRNGSVDLAYEDRT
jgi:hypothetical protein